MFDIEYPAPAERVILAGLQTQNIDRTLFDEDIQEMVMLCRTAGAEVTDIMIQSLTTPKASTYLGTGKIQEIYNRMKEEKCKTLVIDAELSPGQIRNIEKAIQGKVIDRSQLILDIFAMHAETNEARIQVELAQLKTLYPRLTGAWTHFSKQVGGIGTRGPGETQLEVDRRLVQKKIADLKKRLKKIELSRDVQRNKRKDFIKVAIVGYTNVGKSSLLNALSGSEVLVENKLFATLDTATRKTYIPQAGSLVISDTVGFLRKLPHHLVASFRSTLEVVNEADLILIVMDASSQWSEQQLKTVDTVLDDLDVKNKRRMLIFNKADLLTNMFDTKKISIRFPGSILTSAFDKKLIGELRDILAERIQEIRDEREKERIINQQTKDFTTK